MPDTQIHPTGDVSAPADYVIPSAAELLLKMAFARFDGTGAAGSFKPCLRIISDAGTVAGEAVSDDTVAAGGSADVTWFPRVGGGGVASTTNAEWFIARRTSTLSMQAGVQKVLPWSDLFSSDSSLFSLVTQSGLGNGAVQVERAGVVLFQVWAAASILEPNFVMQVNLNSTNGVSMATNTPANQFNTLGLPAGSAPSFGPTISAIQIPDAVPFKTYAQYVNYDAVNRVMGSAQMWGIWWPIGALSPF